jgi:MFS family permease
VPEPPAATVALAPGENVFSVSQKRLSDTFRDIRRSRELFKYLISFIIYNDGIGTIMVVAAIYGAELGFGSVELILAILLVQFVGIPYSLIFGRLPSPGEKRRAFYLAFVLFNLVALPLVGVSSARMLSPEISGAPPVPFTDTTSAAGQGIYMPDFELIQYSGLWETTSISTGEADKDATQLNLNAEPGASMEFPFNGQHVRITYTIGPDHGIWAVYIDDQPLIDPDNNQPITIDAHNPTVRYEVNTTFGAQSPGEHTLRLVNTGEANPSSQGTLMTLQSIEVLQGARQSNLGLILGLVLGLELILLILSFLLGPVLFTGLAERLDTRRSILLALVVYSIVAIWGFFLNSVVEFWFLAWMVAVVQGGSQALSRSLYASLSPASKSGEFFGLFGIMEKFSAFIGPLLFAAAAAIFGSSRPAILSLILIFFLGGYLLTRVNIEEGKRIAQLEDAELLG